MNEGAGDGLEHDGSGRRRPRFSIVTAVYNVSRYLDDFIASIEAQDFDLDELQVVMIDDGSTDDSLEVLTAWAQRRPELVQVHTKLNGGQGSARNAGLGYATGAWVTFLDPDDTIKVDYLSRVSWAIDKEPTIEMIATNRILHFEETGEFAARHPLRAMFAHRDQFRDLDRFPDFFHGSAPAAFFRLDHIRQLELIFDERIQPNFEDGHFCQRYLLGADRPFVAFLKTAEYYYRKRLDQSSTLQTGSLRPSRYIEVPQHGYLELLQEAAERYGRAPEWLQNMIIYELSYYISPEDSSWNTATACHGVVAERFVEIARQIRRELDENVIRSFTVRNLRSEWRQILLYGLAEGNWHTPYVVAHRYDRRRDQALVSFRFTGREPRLAIYVDGEQVQPTASKRRSFVYWDHTLMQERMCWIAAAEGDALRFSLDDTMVELRTNWTDFRPSSIRPYALRRRFGAGLLDPEPAVSEQKALEQAAAQQKERIPVRDRALTSLRALHLPKPSESAGLIKRIGTSTAVKSRFADAWVLMDRVSDSGDSAERLFEYLRANHPDTINAWFVVERDTPDWYRLRRAGVHRLVAYGSPTWKVLMMHCRHLISSHIDLEIIRPRALTALGIKPGWDFTFLQHGVIKDDISGWLNLKNPAVFVTSTAAEYQSIAGDDNRYRFTSKEVKLTGLPRFDRLRELGIATAEEQRNLILFAPTWRDWLNSPLRPGSVRRELAPGFLQSEYAENWLGVLRSPELAGLAERENLQIGFLPHPNLQSILAELDLPEHVQAMRYADHDVQKLFARAAVIVSDYSSIVFNAAYIDRPVVYFQFDRDRVESGGHLGRKGYFSYEDDGFGPVTYTVDRAVEAIVDSVRTGRSTAEPYAARIIEAFPERDGRCCERVTAAISAL